MSLVDRAERRRLASIAMGQVGVREEGGNNCGPKVREYQSATWLEPAAWPWCAAFVDWCVREWVRPMGKDLLFGKESAEAWRPKTAGAFDLLNWATMKGMKILPPLADIEAGDIVIYDMSHCGIVTADQYREKLTGRFTKTFEAVEGNTGSAGGRDANTGDGVFLKVRPRLMVRNFIRLTRE